MNSLLEYYSTYGKPKCGTCGRFVKNSRLEIDFVLYPNEDYFGHKYIEEISFICPSCKDKNLKVDKEDINK